MIPNILTPTDDISIIKPQLQPPPQFVALLLVLLVCRDEMVEIVYRPVQDDRFGRRLLRRRRRRRRRRCCC